MKGKTRCPYCGENIIVEVPDGATGLQSVTCPNCGMKIKINVMPDEKPIQEYSPIHPTVKKIKRSEKTTLAAIFLILSFILGISMGAILLAHHNMLYEGNGEIKGYVVDEKGNGLYDVSIYVDGNFSMRSDEKGRFEIKNISAGEHVLTFEKNGFKKLVVKTFVLPSSISISEKYTLKKGSGEEKITSLTLYAVKFLPVFSYAVITLSFLPLIGGIFCLMRKHFIIVVVSSVFGIFSFGFIVGSLLSIIALILVLLSRDEFEEEIKY